MKNGYQSLRKIAKYFEIFLKIKISHQTIKNWITIDFKDRIENEKHEYSGYYVYDEQFLRLNGVKHYRLLLYDAKINIPVSEKIVKHRIPKTAETFILELTKNKPFISLTTDLFPMYRNITDKLEVKHQLCKFHLYKTINHKLKVHCRRNKLTEEEKSSIYDNAHELKEIFQQKTINESKTKFKEYLKNYNTIPIALKKFIRKHIINSSLPTSTKQKMLDKKTYKYSTYKKDYRLGEKLEIADDYINRLWLNKQQKKEIYHMIQVECPNFKKICGNKNVEQIVGLIVFNTIKNKYSKAKLENYKLFKDLELTDRDYANFIHNVYNNMRKKSYLI